MSSAQDIPRLRIVLVTGPSGAGRSSVINALEDLGFEAIDNLPLSLVPRLLEGPPLTHPLALGVDVRNRDFATETLSELLDALYRNPAVQAELLYVEADTDVLVRRYSETRRRHPLHPAEPPIVGIEAELELLRPFRIRADHLIDTSAMNPHQLRAEIAHRFATDGQLGMTVSVQSFSYKRGLPRGVDMVFDCRFLRNPHWQPELREKDGRTEEVQEYVSADPKYDDFFDRVDGLIVSLLPAYMEEGKTILTIAFGCTGGKHRSVTLAEKLAATLAERGWRVSKRHRELERHGASADAIEQG